MRRARITFQGAFHHAMSHGHEGKPIYEDIKMKQHFLHLLKELSLLLRIRIFAYYLMANHQEKNEMKKSKFQKIIAPSPSRLLISVSLSTSCLMHLLDNTKT
jgi:hypothetical protein